MAVIARDSAVPYGSRAAVSAPGGGTRLVSPPS